MWLLAVEAEAHVKSLGAFSPSSTRRDIANGNNSNLIDRTASIITKMDNHISSATKNKIGEKQDSRPLAKHIKGTRTRALQYLVPAQSLKGEQKGMSHREDTLWILQIGILSLKNLHHF